MTAKTELTRQLLATFAAGTPTAEELDAILKGYIIFKENDEQRLEAADQALSGRKED